MDKFVNTLTQATPQGEVAAVPTSYQPYFNSMSGFQDNAVGANKTGVQAGIDDATRVAGIKDKIAQIQYNSDPKNFKIIQKPDGGQDYADPTGKKITLLQYSQATGLKPHEVLGNSSNRLDQQYVNDYNNLQALTNAALSNDNASLQKIATQLWGDNGKYAKDSKEQKAADAKNAQAMQRAQQFKQSNPDDIIKKFVAYYPNIYTNLPQTGQIHNPSTLPGF